ncbi:MAG: hypothetical protein QNJ09_07655 [Paracoccaceae bacterium]|nr:hypothetical protein [Paracoccaceae bacterium]
MTAPVLHTKRLNFWGPEAGDRSAYAAFYASSDVTVGDYRGGRSAEEIDVILASDRAHWQRHGFVLSERVVA